MNIRVADEVWIGTALLHKEFPENIGFTTRQIVDRVAKENIFGRLRPGIQVHVNLHCVANKRPNPGNYRMLYLLENKKRRLFRLGDDFHPYREGGKIKPKRDQIPKKYHHLIDWYEREFISSKRDRGGNESGYI